MAMIEYDVYKQKLRRPWSPELEKLGDALDIDAVAQAEAKARLEDETDAGRLLEQSGQRSQKVSDPP